MERSIFYKQRFERRFNVSLLAFERLSLLLSQLSEEETSNEETLNAIFHQVVVECCGIAKPKEEDILYLAKRFEELVTQVTNTKSESSEAPKDVVTFGSEYKKMIKSLDMSGLLLMAVGYDIKKAEHLYTQVDREDITDIVEVFIRDEQEKQRVLYEACMYGFGGKYEQDTLSGSGRGARQEGDAVTYDLINSDDGLSELKKFF